MANNSGLLVVIFRDSCACNSLSIGKQLILIISLLLINVKRIAMLLIPNFFVKHEHKRYFGNCD